MRRLNGEKRGNNLYCYSGEDLTLIYYFRCRNCGTVILENYGMEECLTDWPCPTCIPKEDFPFEYFTRQELREDKMLGKMVGLGAFAFFCGATEYEVIKKRREIKKVIGYLEKMVKQSSKM